MLSAMMLTEIMSLLPGNHQIQLRRVQSLDILLIGGCAFAIYSLSAKNVCTETNHNFYTFHPNIWTVWGQFSP